MRINSKTGYVKWAKSFYVKLIVGAQTFNSFQITSDKTSWFLHFMSSVSFIYRVDENGNILQIIWFGLKNLSFSTTTAFF